MSKLSDWKLVPIEPTGDMMNAGDLENAKRTNMRESWSGRIYDAMLAAAPTAPADTTPSAPAQSVDALREALGSNDMFMLLRKRLPEASIPELQCIMGDVRRFIMDRAALATPPRDDATVGSVDFKTDPASCRDRADLLMQQPVFSVLYYAAGMFRAIAREKEAASLTVAPPAEGWRTVPVDPTDEMVAKGTGALTGTGLLDEDYAEDCETMYRAMLAAAPRPGAPS